MKKKHIVVSAIAITVIFSVLFLFSRRTPSPAFDIILENYVAADASVIIRLDNLEPVWAGVKKTNFYAELRSYINWFFREMPSESVSFSGDVNDLQKAMGIKLNEENIVAAFGKKAVFAIWLEDPAEKRFLFVSDLKPGSKIAEQLIYITANRKPSEEYKSIKIYYSYMDKCWCLVSGRLFFSNSSDVLKNAADMFFSGGAGSIARDKYFISEISGISWPNYAYIRPELIGMDKPGIDWSGIKSFLVSVKFSRGILWESFILNKKRGGLKNTKLDVSVPSSAVLYASGNFTEKYLPLADAETKMLIGSKSGFMLLPYNGKFAAAAFCKIKNKGLFLEKFEKWAGQNMSVSTPGRFEYKLPFFGNRKYGYLFVRDYFFIVSPPEYSQKLQNFGSERKKTKEIEDIFNEIKTPKKVCGLFYADPASIFRMFLDGDYFKFIGDVAGYTTASGNSLKTVYYFPLKDLSKEGWKNSFSLARGISGKKIRKEKEKITKQNLAYLRDVIDLYKTKSNGYPAGLDTLVPKYLPEIPAELVTKSSAAVSQMDGSGGWFYKDGWIFMNVYDRDSKGRFYTQW